MGAPADAVAATPGRAHRDFVYVAVRRLRPGRLASRAVAPAVSVAHSAPILLRFGTIAIDCTEPDRLAEAPAFVELNEIIALRTWLYDRLPANREDLKDKRRFYRRAVAAGLPTPAVLATVSGGRILEAPSRLPDQDLFTKEAHALNVRGATYWVRRNEGTYVSSSGQNVAHGAFLEHLAAQSSAAPFVVQPRLLNHPAVAPWSMAGLCTVRVMTTRPPDGPPTLLRACLRMPTGHAAADNSAAGGVASPIDLETGVLGPAVQKSAEVGPRSVGPSSDDRRGHHWSVLPFYSEVFALALEAHRVFGEFPSIGWDIGITRDGPMIVEGNQSWDINLGQQPHGSSLATTPFAEHFWAHASAARLAGSPQSNVATHLGTLARPWTCIDKNHWLSRCLRHAGIDRDMPAESTGGL